MLDKVKKALRISKATFDDEVTDLIDAAIADLRLVGINVPENVGSSGSPDDPLFVRAIILYCKANFGYIDGAERYRAAYDYLKCALSLAGGNDE